MSWRSSLFFREKRRKNKHWWPSGMHQDPLITYARELTEAERTSGDFLEGKNSCHLHGSCCRWQSVEKHAQKKERKIYDFQLSSRWWRAKAPCSIPLKKQEFTSSFHIPEVIRMAILFASNRSRQNFKKYMFSPVIELNKTMFFFYIYLLKDTMFTYFFSRDVLHKYYKSEKAASITHVFIKDFSCALDTGSSNSWSDYVHF